MNLSPEMVRANIPLPKNKSKLLAWVLFGLGSVWLFDVYSKSSDGIWPITSIFPW